jgi:hypothetical protein
LNSPFVLVNLVTCSSLRAAKHNAKTAAPTLRSLEYKKNSGRALCSFWKKILQKWQSQTVPAAVILVGYKIPAVLDKAVKKRKDLTIQLVEEQKFLLDQNIVVLVWRLAAASTINDPAHLDKDRNQVREIAVEALKSWNPNKKTSWHYYEPKRRIEPNRWAWPAPADLQKIVFGLTEAVESIQEQEYMNGLRKLDEENFIFRYLKHMIFLCYMRNLLELVIGMFRVLRKYSIEDVEKVYSIVTQTSAGGQATADLGVKGDSQHSRRKTRLIRVLKARFKDFIEYDESLPKNEIGLIARKDQIEKTCFVSRLLSELLLPWQSKHVLTSSFKVDEAIAELDLLGVRRLKLQGERHLLSSLHVLICPSCLGHLAAGAEMPEPNEMLNLPVFFHLRSNDSGNSSYGPTNIPEPEPQEVLSVLSEVISHKKRVRSAFFRTLLIRVDERAPIRVPLEQGSTATFNIAPGAKYIRIYGIDHEDNLLLGGTSITHTWHDEEPWQTSFVCEGGQKIDFEITPEMGPDGEVRDASIKINYQEMNWLKKAVLAAHIKNGAVSRWWRKPRLFPRSVTQRRWRHTLATAGIAAVIVSITVTGYFLYDEPLYFIERAWNHVIGGSSRPALEAPPVNNNSSEPGIAETIRQPRETSESKKNNSNTNKGKQLAQENPRRRKFDFGKETLGAGDVEDISEVRRIYLRLSYDSPNGEVIISTLERSLIRRFQIMKSPNKSADAYLHIEIEELGNSIRIKATLLSLRERSLGYSQVEASGQPESTLLERLTERLADDLLRQSGNVNKSKDK